MANSQLCESHLKSKEKMNTRVLTQLRLLLEELGIDNKDPEYLLGSDILADLLKADPANINRANLRDQIGLPPIGIEFVVDYEMSPKEMVAAGLYDEFQLSHSGFDINLFLISGSGKVSFSPKLFSSDEDMENQGFRPARIEEFLAYNAAFRGKVTKVWVTATGSIVEHLGQKKAVTSGYDYNERILDFCSLPIPPFHSRLGVRK